MRSILLCLILSGALSLKGQVINVESKRIVIDTIGWAGSLGLDFNLTKNATTVFAIGHDAHIQYKHFKHLILFINDINFVRANGGDFVNDGTQHLRYNYRFHPRIAWEAFGQTQYNQISKIKLRALAGTGPRFKLTKNENYKVYLGSLYMFEFENISEEVVNSKDHRWSSYLSFSLYPKNNISISSTSYIQPKLTNFRDFRISSSSQLSLGIIGSLSLSIGFDIIYDALPPSQVPKLQYILKNGLKYVIKKRKE